MPRFIKAHTKIIMKTTLLLPIATAALLSVGNSFAGISVALETYQHPLTVSLTLASQENISMVRSKVRPQKLLTSRFSNKEMLEALLAEDAGIATAMGGSIKGWSIVLITNSEGDVVGTALTKKNTNPIDVTEYFGAEKGPEIQGATEKRNAVNIQSVSLTRVSINLDELNTDLQGVLNINSLYKEGVESSTTTIQSAQFTDLSGYWSPSYDEWQSESQEITVNELVKEFNGVVTGTVTAGRPAFFNFPG